MDETIRGTATQWRQSFPRELNWTWMVPASTVNVILRDMEELERQIGDLSTRLAVALQALKESETPASAPSPYPEVVLVPRDAR